MKLPSTFFKPKQNPADKAIPQIKRIDSLDWLRGLMALSIMAYHISGWYFTQPDAASFLGRLGIYGVSIFFILSGLSMAIVYHQSFTTIKATLIFFTRRIFRIWPLLWVTTLATVALTYYTKTTLDFYKIVINLTTAFGFIDPGGYIATGAWSIGNEMVYYAFTPLLLISYNYKRWLGNLLCALTFIVGYYFCFYALSPAQTLGKQWITYINPFNNLFLYTAGIAIFYNLRDISFSRSDIAFALICILTAFIFYPATGNQINIVIGWHRISLVILSILLVVAFFKFSIPVPKFIAYPLEKLGIVTYGVYLLHPVTNSIMQKLFIYLHIHSNWVMALSVISATILFSLASYYFFEVKLMSLGKKLTTSKYKAG